MHIDVGDFNYYCHLKNDLFYLSIYLFIAKWIKKHFETPGVISLTDEEKRTLLARLIRSTL